MFQKAQFRLSLLYSLFFLLLFWSMSLGIYFWTSNFFSQQYKIEISERYQHEHFDADDKYYEQISAIAAEIALDRLKTILLILDSSLLLLVPVSAWILTGKSLAPVEEAHAREKEFVSDAAHDLRTPLAILGSEMEVALLKDRTPGEYKKLLRSNKEEVERLSSLVENLLFLARQDQKKQKASFSAVDLVDVVSSVAAKYQPLMKSKKLKFKALLPGESMVLEGNKIMLEQLFSNLVANAIAYTHKGEISVSMSNKDSLAVIEVKDTGIGINKANQARIFERFFRADPSRSKTVGSGLGLAISKSIAEIHRGKIEVKSREGQGSSFIVYLPLIQNPGK